MIPYRVLLERRSDSPDKIAFISAKSGEEITFSALAVRAYRLAAGLRDSGIGKGDVIATLLPNGMEIVELYTAAGAVGSVFQPMDFRFQGEELRNALVHTDVGMIICDISVINDGVESAIPQKTKKIVVGGSKDGWIEYKDMFVEPAQPLDSPEIDEENDIALFLYTSGSTSGIKCVPVTWRQLDFFPADLTETWGKDLFTRGISLLPMSHISGPVVINICLLYGFSYVITNRFRPNAVLELMERYKVTWTHTVPSIAGMLLQGDTDQWDTRHLKFIALMGTSVPVSLLRAFERDFPSLTAVQGYGLTETSPLLTLETPDDHDRKIGSIGKAMREAEIRLVDKDGQDVPMGEPGELIVRGPRVFRGYYGNPSLTAKVIRDGWFHTGDVAKQDSDGFYYHLGRLDDMIITGGLNVFPAEVEAAAAKFPGLRESVVYALPDDVRGNAISMDICLCDGAKMDVGILRNFLKKHLAEYKIPRKINIVESIAHTATGKPIRKRK